MLDWKAARVSVLTICDVTSELMWDVSPIFPLFCPTRRSCGWIRILTEFTGTSWWQASCSSRGHSPLTLQRLHFHYTEHVKHLHSILSSGYKTRDNTATTTAPCFIQAWGNSTAHTHCTLHPGLRGHKSDTRRHNIWNWKIVNSTNIVTHTAPYENYIEFFPTCGYRPDLTGLRRSCPPRRDNPPSNVECTACLGKYRVSVSRIANLSYTHAMWCASRWVHSYKLNSI